MLAAGNRPPRRWRGKGIDCGLTIETEHIMVLIGVEAALVRAEGRVAFGAARRADAAVEVVGHGTPMGSLWRFRAIRGKCDVIAAARPGGQARDFPESAVADIFGQSLGLRSSRGRRRNRGIASLLFPAWSREKRLQLLRRQALVTSRPRAEDETEAVTAKIAADLRPGCRPFPIAGAAPGYARDQTVAIDNLYDI